MSLISQDPDGIAAAEITRLYVENSYSAADVTRVQRALRVAALPASWKQYFRERLAQIAALG
jgi:hypothetical protein